VRVCHYVWEALCYSYVSTTLCHILDIYVYVLLFILTVLAHESFFLLSAYVSVCASVRVCHYVWAQALCYSYVSTLACYL